MQEQDKQDAAEADDVPKGLKGNAAKAAARQVGKNQRKNYSKKASNAEPVVEASSTSLGSSATDNGKLKNIIFI